MSQTIQKVTTATTPDPRLRSLRRWAVFTHPRIGFELPVPPGISAAGIPETAPQSRFVSDDGEFVMTAWGGLSQAPSRILEWQWRQAQTVAGRSINYQRKERSWFVVSGHDRTGMEFYQKFMVRGNRVATFTLTYPHSRVQEFDSWVSKVEDGFSITSEPAPQPPATIAATPPASQPAAHPPTTGREKTIAQIRHFRRYSETSAEKESEPGEPVISLTPLPKKDLQKEPPVIDPLPLAGENLEKPQPKTVENPPAAESPPKEDVPYGAPVAGKPGFIYSPYSEKNNLVDAVDIPRGTKVKCPYTGKVFRIP
ncbi:MAG TPA: hypothetical protein VG796_04950 [Verrucomicrobiales bacterium]|nr:hypothetical protein [Verrucomicrobiales bacterium]